MMYAKTIATLLLAFVILATATAPALAAIDTQNLGAKYDATNSNIIFRVYSSQATRIELDLYAISYGAPEVANYVLTEDASDIWSVTVPVSALTAAGINGAVFYGYRAWGPNWPYSSSWTKGSSAGFIADVDAAGNRFNPNKLLFDPMRSNSATIRSIRATAIPRFLRLAPVTVRSTAACGRPRGLCWRPTRAASARNRPARKKTTSSTKCMCAG
jgi:hypothetical protein